MTRNLRRPRGTHRILDLLSQQVQRIVVDLASLARPAHTADHLFPAEGFGNATALDYGQHRGLYGGESSSTFGARPPAPDRLAFIGFPGIDHPRIGMPAERAMHGRSFAVLTSGYHRRLRAYLCAPAGSHCSHD
ncbi:Uncharacterised protein [Mycobacterium tuberculosis]|nr:Uncharacterised protein [Mycobacterium tuberculosis]